MERTDHKKNRTKGYIFLGFIILFCLVVGIIKVINSRDDRNFDRPIYGVQPDICSDGVVPPLGVGGWYSESVTLGDTSFVASVGAVKAHDGSGPPFEAYSIGVEFIRPYKSYDSGEMKTALSPFFLRWFINDQIPMELWTKTPEEVVVFEEETLVVTFQLGFTNISCQIPTPIK